MERKAVRELSDFLARQILPKVCVWLLREAIESVERYAFHFWKGRPAFDAFNCQPCHCNAYMLHLTVCFLHGKTLSSSNAIVSNKSNNYFKHGNIVFFPPLSISNRSKPVPGRPSVIRITSVPPCDGAMEWPRLLSLTRTIHSEWPLRCLWRFTMISGQLSIEAFGNKHRRTTLVNTRRLWLGSLRSIK